MADAVAMILRKVESESGPKVTRDAIQYLESLRHADVLNDPKRVATTLRRAGYARDAEKVLRMTPQEYDHFVSRDVV